MPSITGFLSRYKYFAKDEPKPPPISTGTAIALLVIYTLIYVVPFYLSATTRPSRSLSRDAPPVIRARVASVSVTCVVCSAVTLVILTSGGHATARDALHSMGYWPPGLRETASSLLLTALLFAGPLYESLVVDGAWRDCLSLQPVARLFREWTTWRNIVAGPVTEEVLFRSASVPLMLAAQAPVRTTIFLSPLIFGLAHVHHFYEFRVTHPHVPAAAQLLRSLLQLAYTSLFGAYATFVFLRTASLPAIVAVHAFCNCMGLPRFWGRVDPPPRPGDRPASVLYTVVYYVLLIAGAVGWWKSLGVLTESSNALVPIDM